MEDALETCSVDGCGRGHIAKGYCDRHYRNFIRTGNPLGATRRNERGASTRHPLYRIWSSMWRRCTEPQNNSYRNYGARGISVCERWRDFWQFADDIGPRPSANHSIDRIDVNGNYEPSNCRWATPLQQSRNRRTCRLTDDDRSLIERLVAEGWTKRRIALEHDLNYEAVLNFASGFTYRADTTDHAAVAPAAIVPESDLAFRPPLRESICAVDACERDAYRDGYCRKHWRHLTESKSLAKVADPFALRKCLSCEAELPTDSRPDMLFCSHACKMRSYRSEGRFSFRGVCKFPSCKEEIHAHELCSAHAASYVHAVESGALRCDSVEGRIAVIRDYVPKPRLCVECGTEFTPSKHRNASFCSNKCYFRDYRRKNPRKR